MRRAHEAAHARLAVRERKHVGLPVHGLAGAQQALQRPALRLLFHRRGPPRWRRAAAPHGTAAAWRTVAAAPP